jgi:hypothetical protein
MISPSSTIKVSNRAVFGPKKLAMELEAGMPPMADSGIIWMQSVASNSTEIYATE